MINQIFQYIITKWHKSNIRMFLIMTQLTCSEAQGRNFVCKMQFDAVTPNENMY